MKRWSRIKSALTRTLALRQGVPVLGIAVPQRWAWERTACSLAGGAHRDCPRRLSVLPIALVGTVALATPAHAVIPMTLVPWSCHPSTVYIDPAAPSEVTEAVAQWHKAFRPDWTYVTSLPADVEVWMKAPADKRAAGVTSLSGTPVRTHATVELDPANRALGDLARHELGHVAGLEHNYDTQFSAMNPYPLMHRYGVSDLAGMAFMAKRCA